MDVQCFVLKILGPSLNIHNWTTCSSPKHLLGSFLLLWLFFFSSGIPPAALCNYRNPMCSSRPYSVDVCSMKNTLYLPTLWEWFLLPLNFLGILLSFFFWHYHFLSCLIIVFWMWLTSLCSVVSDSLWSHGL